MTLSSAFYASVREKYRVVYILFLVAVFIPFLTRAALLVSFHNTIDDSFLHIVTAFTVGLLYDILIAGFVCIPVLLQVSFTNNFIYSKKGSRFGLAFFLAAGFILFFTAVLPKDYNVLLYRAVAGYFLFRFAVFALLYFLPAAFRDKWRTVLLRFLIFFIIFLLTFNAVSEWFFWNEFASRYNFIAVDYLVYTNEVAGNIRESYPIFLIVPPVLAVAGLIFFFAYRPAARSVRTGLKMYWRLAVTGVWIATALLIASFFPAGLKYFSKNSYTNELAGNGIYDFVQAFKNKELDFYTYYKTLPDASAFSIMRAASVSASDSLTGSGFSNDKMVRHTGPEKKMNVVLISVESLSASFMKAFGNTQNITPGLDSLADEGLSFTNLYASGTRTVRGLEALTLSVPPLPGESLVKRPGNENLFSLGAVFTSKGYLTQFLYGGYAYFDNMNYFFSHNGYEVIDRTAISGKDIHYANIWGVADEDLFTLSLRTLDKNYRKGKLFFSHIMTVSNHRPFTYPEGRIDISPVSKSREGAVKYTDYAITKFIRDASRKPWFKNTLFVIVADHCASSAGKQTLPVKGYHIPMIIYSPGNITPQKAEQLTAQIDVAPTILGLLNFSYRSKFFGRDALDTGYRLRHAFISTYQGLGYLKNDTLTVQSPVKKVKAYRVNRESGNAKEIKVSEENLAEAIAYYQSFAWLIKNNRFSAQP